MPEEIKDCGSDFEELVNAINTDCPGGFGFITIKDVTPEEASPAESYPANNDGRTTCAWCGAPTRKAGGGAYDVCTKCGK